VDETNPGQKSHQAVVVRSIEVTKLKNPLSMTLTYA